MSSLTILTESDGFIGGYLFHTFGFLYVVRNEGFDTDIIDYVDK